MTYYIVLFTCKEDAEVNVQPADLRTGGPREESMKVRECWSALRRP